MDLEVVGRHALQFIDEAAAAFVNSTDALVDWHSLLIDRYDVRHLLSAPPPPRKRRNPQLPLAEPELDHERYLDLPQLSNDQGLEEVANPVEAGGYHTVSFSYGNAEDSADQKISDAGVGCPGFHPPFPLPESLLQNLPPTEKAHQIIARTATFVSKHGGQSEIILRVKQGDNPTFGFLMPDNHLHPYFRFLVDHQELLRSDVDGQDGNGDKKADTHQIQMGYIGGGALSLLGSVYGTGEEDDNAAEDPQASKEVFPGDAPDPTFLHNSAQRGLSVKATLEEEGSYRNLPSKNKGSVVRKNPPIGPSKVGSTSAKRKEVDSFGSVSISQDKSGLPKEISEIEPLILEPPSEMKRVIDKIVEFIMKNGKQFEAVLIEQDRKHGRFPFLLHSGQYHPYYLRVLQKAQESKLTGKSFLSEKFDSCGSGLDKKSSTSKESNLSLKSAGCDIPYDSERREKFKMVIGKSKKDGQDPPSKASQQQPEVSLDAAAAAAILQAATRGIKNTDFRILSGTSLNGNSHGHSSEGGQSLSLGSAAHKSYQNGSNINSVSLAKVISKTAALDAANEADSSDAHLTLEEKRKAERLKRAKMFVALLKTGPASVKTEPLRALSAEPQGSGFSGSAADFVPAAKEREGSLAPLDVGTSDNNGMSEKKVFTDEYNERRSMRKYRSRSSRLGEEQEDDVEERKHKHSKKKHRSRHSRHEDDKKEETEVEERDRECSKKHRSRHSSHGDDEAERDHKHLRKEHRSRHSSHEDDDDDDDDDDERDEGKRDHRKSKKKRYSCDCSHYEEDEDKEESDHRHSRSKHKSHCSSHHSRDRHKHWRSHSSKDRESGHRHKHGSSSEDDDVQHTRSDKHRKAFHSEELEEGEISAKTSDHSRGSIAAAASREASVSLSSSCQERRTPSQPSETAEVSDDLRAKIRAMLRATM